jgi:hypothetical protein
MEGVEKRIIRQHGQDVRQSITNTKDRLHDLQK